DLGDKRRNRRCMATVQAFWNTPDASIPEASRSPAELQGIYGLLSADTTNPEAIRQAHASAVVRRVEGLEEIYVVHDTSELACNTLRGTEGLGRLSGSYSRGGPNDSARDGRGPGGSAGRAAAQGVLGA